MRISAGFGAIAVAYPKTVRTNDFWRTKYPDAVAAAESKGRVAVWNSNETIDADTRIFAEEMAKYLDDPFRGVLERRVLGPGETALEIEVRAAQSALRAAKLRPDDIDLVIIASLYPDRVWVGNGVYFAKQMGLRCAAWNLESACSSGLAALGLATSQVRAGESRNVLVIVSCTYSRAIDERNGMSWFSGDGAAAFIVQPVQEGFGWLGAKSINTAETIDSFSGCATSDEGFGQKLLLTPTKVTGPNLMNTAGHYLRTCCDGALQAAGVQLQDIDFFAFATPTAWYSAFCARTLGFSQERTYDCFPLFSNMGPVLMPTNLYFGAQQGKVRKGSLVLLYTVGSVSSAAAAVVRWGDCNVAPFAT